MPKATCSSTRCSPCSLLEVVLDNNTLLCSSASCLFLASCYCNMSSTVAGCAAGWRKNLRVGKPYEWCKSVQVPMLMYSLLWSHFEGIIISMTPLIGGVWRRRHHFNSLLTRTSSMCCEVCLVCSVSDRDLMSCICCETAGKPFYTSVKERVLDHLIILIR